ncbi:hypothetical protein [Janibacter sp. G1551]|jgi:hypothetical protein|uniref:hypothetical protein n=1 Tax=Janibacter sp. G1551 TaxID=3420440 RepID=UPI003D066AF8
MSRPTADESDLTPEQREQWLAALAKIEQMNAERDAAEADANLVAEAGVCPECLRLAKDAE